MSLRLGGAPKWIRYLKVIRRTADLDAGGDVDDQADVAGLNQVVLLGVLQRVR